MGCEGGRGGRGEGRQSTSPRRLEREIGGAQLPTGGRAPPPPPSQAKASLVGRQASSRSRSGTGCGQRARPIARGAGRGPPPERVAAAGRTARPRPFGRRGAHKGRRMVAGRDFQRARSVAPDGLPPNAAGCRAARRPGGAGHGAPAGLRWAGAGRGGGHSRAPLTLSPAPCLSRTRLQQLGDVAGGGGGVAAELEEEVGSGGLHGVLGGGRGEFFF